MTIVSTIDAAGLVQIAASAEIVGFVGPVGTTSAGDAGGITLRGGPVGMVVLPVGFSVESSALAINEAGSTPEEGTRTQLGGLAVNDDATKDPVPASAVTWTQPPANYALASISEAGIASAGTVYEDTVASFVGSHAGLDASNSITVRNVLSDNFGDLAGDTFDDAWQMDRGITSALDPDAASNGKPNWMLYAMDITPGAPAGSPVDIQEDSNGYFAITYTRNPRATGYTFTVEEASDLTAGFAPLVNPVSVTNTTPDGGVMVTTRSSTPMSEVGQQYLRVRVDKDP